MNRDIISKLGSIWGRFRDKVRKEGFRQVIKTTALCVYNRYAQQFIRALYQPTSIYLHSRLNNRYNAFNEEWDLLITLDGCRFDALKLVADEHSFLGEIDSRWSVGAQSVEWMVNTFTQDYRNEISEMD